MENDTPITPVTSVLAQFGFHTDIVFVTGREEVYRKVTTDWLNEFIDAAPTYLFMRAEKDYRSDEVIKEELLQKAMGDVGFRLEDILFVIEDRKKVKRMWVNKGLFVLDVNQTDEEF